MAYIFNPKTSEGKRKGLRRESTIPEKYMWSRLRGKQMHGYKFRRQFGVDRFIIDFYCPELKLAIEIDGKTHLGEKAEQYDIWREKHLDALGIQCIRFSDDEVLKRLDDVTQKIWKIIDHIKEGVER
jgi:very-short-patch-repair endonuclease